MNLATHPVAPEEVMAFIDGELSSRQVEAVSTHIDACAECSKLAEQLRGTSQSISAWRIPTIPANVEHSITALAAKTASAPKIKSGLLLRASFWTWKQWALQGGTALAALLVVLAIAAPNLLRSRRQATHIELYDVLHRTDGEDSGHGSLGKIQKDFSVDGQPRTDQHSKVFQNRRESPAAGEFGKQIGRPITDQQSKVAENGRNVRSLITLSSPGVAADSNGLFHGLGDHPLGDHSASAAPAPMIAHVASLSIMTKDFAGARTALDTILARHHGYSAQLNIGTPENAPRSLNASLRIPAPELSSAVADLKTLGRVENESHTGEEVTKQHTDLVERLRVSRETEQRFLAILQQRTGNIFEVLQVEEGIARVRGDIERMEAEQKALEHRVDFATVELQITEEFKAELNPPAPSVSTRIHNALVAGYQNASETVLGIVLFFAENGPVLVIWLAILALPVALVWRRYRRIAAAA